MDIQAKRALLDSANGKFFSVEFIKKDGSLREMTVKKWIESAFTYGSDNAQANPVAHKPEMYTAVDMEKGQFRNINLNTLKKVKINGETHTF
jgi:hypothetical protein